MSAVVAINLGFYVLVVSDTRLAYKRSGEDILAKIDTCKKIKDTGIGLMSGLGFARLLDSVDQAVASADITDTDQITEIIAAHRQRWLATPFATDEYAHDSIEKWTYWFFSYATGPTEESERIGEHQTLRLAYSNHESGLLQFLTSAVGCPHGTSEDRHKELNESLAARIRPMTDWSQFDESMAYHLGLAGSIIRELAEENEYVSPAFQVGLHSLRHGIHVSDIFPLLRAEHHVA